MASAPRKARLAGASDVPAAVHPAGPARSGCTAARYTASRHGPSTISEVLERARVAMDEADRREEMERDPIAWARAHRPRRNLLERLLYGRER